MPPASALQRKQYQIFIDRNPDAVWAFLTNPQNHARLCPDEMPEEVLSDSNAELADGSRIILRVKRPGAALTVQHTLIWEIAEWNPTHGYALRQVEGPFKAWINRRKLTPFQGGTLLADQVEYVPPGGPFGALTIRPFVDINMDKYYQHRHNEAKRLLERIGRIKGRDAL